MPFEPSIDIPADHLEGILGFSSIVNKGLGLTDEDLDIKKGVQK